jgi:uncharacterized coiled-coil protein SlyX
MEKKFDINLLVVGLALLLVFALGMWTRNGIVGRKEIRALETQISGEKRIIVKQKDTITTQEKTITLLRGMVTANKANIASLQKEVKILDSQIANYQLTLPPNEVYAELQEVYPDTAKKEWPFSTPQINGIYTDKEELGIRKQEIFKYESITGMLTYNIQLLEITDSVKYNQLRTCLAVTDEYQKMMDLKDKQIKEWMKRGRGRMAWGLTSTGVAAALFVLLLVP